MASDAFLPGDRLDLRPLHESDVPALREALNSPAVWTMTGDLTPSSPAEACESHAAMRDDPDTVLFVMDDGSGPVGRIRLKRMNRQSGFAWVSYFVLPDHHGEGFATEAVELVVEYAFAQQRLHKVHANTLDENVASQRVLEKVGFTREGTNREDVYVMDAHRDIYRWGILEHEWREGR